MCPPERSLVVKAAAAVSAPLAPRTLDWDETHIELRALVPKSFAVRHLLVPLSLVGDLLCVAMPKPEDEKALRRLRLITRCQIQPLLAEASKIREAIAQLYA